MSVSMGSDTTYILMVAASQAHDRLMTQALESAGWSVEPAESAEGAFDVLRTRPVDVVISQMKLPEMNGAQFVQAAFRMHPQLTALLLVGPGESSAARPATANGVCEMISMDTEPEFLVMAVERLLSRREAARRSLWQNTKDVLLSLMKAIASAIDSKSDYSAMHSKRVAELCVQACPWMDLSTYESKTLELAAHVHDFGKIGTPDEVLLKPGTLNDEEWVDVLKHPAFGSIIFAEIEELADVAAAIRHHHEHFNGSGYPDGLTGEAIPKLARILAVADAYEAMTSPRPYRPALTHDDAVLEMQKNSAVQFDPWVVERFLESIEYAVEDRRAA